MKHIITVLIVLFGAYLSFANDNEKISSNDFPAKNNSELPSSGITCNPTDSLALVDLYNSTFGFAWMNQWPVLFGNTIPVCDWYGVTVRADGRVTRVELSGNSLFGPIPSSIGNLTEIIDLKLNANRITGTLPTTIGNLTKLEIFWVANNEMIGSIPTSIGNLVNLQSFFIDDNGFTGSLPTEMENLVSLMTFFMDNNEIEGEVPFGMTLLPVFRRFEFFNNKIDSLPDFTGVIMNANWLKTQNNRLTFDDILPNYGTPLGNFYHPQDSIGIEETQTAFTGTTHIIDLDIDDGITDNEYVWYKNGSYFTGPTNSNQLAIGPIDFTDAGVYTCEVTNPGAPLLTLYSRPVTLVIECGISVNRIELTLCTGTDTIINGTTYNASRPMGTEDVTDPDQYGCDSIIQIDLTFQDPPIDSQYYTLCPLGQVEVGGELFNLGRPTGTVVIEDGIGPGCDSTIFVEVDFLDVNDLTGNLNGPFCIDTSFTFNGLTYDRNNRTGFEVLPGGSAIGCDSFLVISLSFYPENIVNYAPTICNGDSVVIQGNVYNFGNPTGTEVLENADINGCDSTMNIALQFAPGVVIEYKDTICQEDEIMVNGTPYNFSNQSGTETFTVGACDSVVNVDLSFYPIAEGNYSETICIGDTVTINGEDFFQGNLSSLQTLEDASQHLCDSFVNVTVDFYPASTGNFNTTICPEDTININGTDYFFGSNNGVEILTDQDQYGCDSILNVNISFHPDAIGNYSVSIGQNDTITILGTEYHQNNPTGTAFIEDASQFGCDSTVNIVVNFLPFAVGNYTDTICLTETITLNTTEYSFSNPTGTDTLLNGAQSGADSLVNVIIEFYPEAEGTFSTTICSGDSIEINGVIFNASNLTATTDAPAPSQNGCDSTTVVTIDFYPPAMGSHFETICQGDTIEINGVLFHNNNLTQITTSPTPSQNGCDSLVEVFLDFYSAAIGTFDPVVCANYSTVINGTTYDISRQSGQETIEGIAAMGCDSIVNIDLQFIDLIDTLINPTWCPDQSIIVDNVEYNFNNRTGMATLPSIQSPGCDSIVNIDLNFHNVDTTLFNPQFCADGFVIINNNRYDIVIPSGQEILTSTVTGCDSVVNIDLSFGSEIITEIDLTLCPGDSLVVDNEVFNFGRPTGSVLFPALNPGDCDSTVNVTLDFYQPAIGDYNPVLCIGDNIEVGGVVFDATNLSQQVTVPELSSNGCDSLVNVSISFHPAALGEYIATLCEGDTIVINGTPYHQGNPNGIEFYPEGSQFGCDSTLAIDLTFNNSVITPIGGILCFGDSAIVNGTVYNAMNPSALDTIDLGGSCDSILDISYTFYNEAIGVLTGDFCEPTTFDVGGITVGPINPIDTIVIENGSINGCDSTVFVNLNYYLNTDSLYIDHLCYEDFIIVNGVRIDRDNPSEIFNFPGMGGGGCDSSLTVNLTFTGEAFEIFQETLCNGDSIQVNNVWYHKDNPTGIETIIGGSSEGCDSIVDMRLSFLAPITGLFEGDFCDGASFEINGETYDINNPTGTEVFINASAQGCDSTLTIDLSFTQVVTVEMDTMICEGAELMIGDTSLNQAGLHEVNILSSTGCDSILMITLELEDPFVFGIADAGPDDIICEEFGMLNASLNTEQIGFWTSNGTAIVDHINQFDSGTSNLQPGENVFVWSVSSDVCQDYATDTAIITYYPLPIPAEDSFYIPFGINLFDLDLLTNDTFPEGVESPFTVNINMSEGGLVMQEDTLVQFIPQLGFDGLATGSYEICGVYCPDFCLEVPFEIEIQGRIGDDDILEVPNGITPNNDGANDILIIDELLENPDEFPDNELMIFNRWGDVLYQAKPYNNDWNGKNFNGQDLPEGTYYYVLRLNIGAGNIQKGDITILR